MRKIKIAIVGATGLVGQKMIEVLCERKIQADYCFFASKESQGKCVNMGGVNYPIIPLEEENIFEQDIDYALFALDAELAKRFVPLFIKCGAVVIDNSSAFRRKKGVPLVAANVNEGAIKPHHKLIANPNCSTIQLVSVLEPIRRIWGLKRVVVSTYQAVSGAGQKALEDLDNNTACCLPYVIADNLIPQIDIFLKNGNTFEEDKLIFESRKILGQRSLKLSATAVRVPVRAGHSESVNITLKKSASVRDVESALKVCPGIVVLNQHTSPQYPMPIMVQDSDKVLVGRIRKDTSEKNSLNLFIVSNNLRRGAASNAIDILEKLVGLR